jgi:ABC-type branched-subunit amino acid transport system substrate-binding protein
LFTRTAVGADGGPEIAKAPAGLSTGEALRLGEAMYRKGVLPSGEPLTGFVQGDIEVKGQMLTCTNCHMRSGLGSYEGGVATLPTNGAKLYSPLRTGFDLPGTSMGTRPLKAPRPAYTDQTLAKAMWEGIDPAGRVLSETMPRYVMNDRDMEIMIFYLKNLSSTFSPGVSSEGIRLATIVSEGLKPEDRESMIGPMMSFVRRFPLKLTLDVWELKGPQETWKEQLEKQYQQQPVFALVGGMVTGSWRPIHEFCEKSLIPSIYPITDLPVVSDSDWYTLYFSKGYYQEGEAAAKYLEHGLELPPDKQIVQVFRETDEGKALVQGFTDFWKKLEKQPVIDKVIPANETTGVDFWKRLAAAHPDAVLLLWLGPEDFAGIESLGEVEKKPFMAFASSTMLDETFLIIPDKIRSFTYVTYPYGLPEERKTALKAIDQFSRSRDIHPTNKTISGKVFSLTSLLSQALGGMKNNRYRDNLLDLFDMMEDQEGYSVRYPRLSFGPGQRYGSKGCYIVTLGEGPQPQLIKKSEWVIF